ncbi:hypothetical protein KRMM14A1004_39070 [Krasilnikovia sp. MM14-A1004]
MPVLFIFVVGIAVALIRRHFLVAPERRPSGDAPARLLGWAVGLLADPRQEWGQAMIGELDRLDGRARRWRFALGCVIAALAMPPWGRAAAALGALMAVAAGAGGLDAYTHMHYRLHTDGWTWVGAVILILILTGYILGGSMLLRRPGVAAPGLAGGLLVAAAWLAAGGFTFDHWLNSYGLGSRQWLLLLAPIAVGVAATLWGGSDAVGRRATRLAAVTAALSIYLYGVLAVAVHGAIGHDPSDGWTTAQIVADNLGNQAVFYLVALPLVTTAIGWAAAAATARLRHAPPAAPVLAASGPGSALAGTTHAASAQRRPTATNDHPAASLPNATTARQRRTWYVLLLCAAAVSAAILVALTLMRP